MFMQAFSYKISLTVGHVGWYRDYSAGARPHLMPVFGATITISFYDI